MTLDDMKILYEERAAQYAALKAAAETSAAAWYWATGSMTDLVPFYHEIGRYSRGRAHKAEPADRSEEWHIGTGADGRIVVERHYTSLPGLFYETFITYGPDVIESVTFDYGKEKKLNNIMLFLYSGGLLLTMFMYARRGKSQKLFSYEQGEISRITETHVSLDDGRETHSIYTIGRDSLGRVETISDQNGHVYYKKKPAGTGWKELSAVFLEKLPALAAAELKKRNHGTPIYSVVLLYGSENMFPPALGMGLLPQKEAWMREKGKDARWMIWNPAEYETPLIDLTGLDTRLDSACGLLNQVTEMEEKESAARALLVEACRALKVCLEASGLPLTPDCLVFPVHYELTDFKANIRKLYGAETVDTLKEKGLLI